MAPYLYLIVSGSMLAFASFAFAAYNMAHHAKNMFESFDAPTSPRFARGAPVEASPLASFGAMFSKHLGAMVAMMFGGFMVVAGVALAVFDLLHLL